jgi:hypothetical protein
LALLRAAVPVASEAIESNARASGESGDYGRPRCGQIIGGERDEVFEQTNIVPFPLTVRGVPPRADPAPTKYEFTEQELAALCRWFSAMKYAFPGTEGVMMVNHQENYSAVGLYNRAGGAPNCLVAKHEVGGTAHFFWSTEFDSPRPIGGLAEITDAHIRAIRPPRNEKGWLDPAGWMGVYASRLIATQLQVV